MKKYPQSAVKVTAQYTPQKRGLYQGNPWIEALENNPDDKELYMALKTDIAYSDEERIGPAYERKEGILVMLMERSGYALSVAASVVAASVVVVVVVVTVSVVVVSASLLLEQAARLKDIARAKTRESVFFMK